MGKRSPSPHSPARPTTTGLSSPPSPGHSSPTRPGSPSPTRPFLSAVASPAPSTDWQGKNRQTTK